MASTSDGLLEAVDYLTDDSGERKPNVRVDNAIAVVERVAKRQGLTPQQIDTLMDYVAGEGKGSVSCRNRVIRCLIPRSTVPHSAVLKALGCMTSLPSSPLQQLLFRWIVLTFDLVDDRGPLHAVYTAVFYFLQMDDLRPTVCQLLCYLTRREDVTEFRVQKIMELQKRVLAFKGTEPPLTALLAVYKTYCPHLVTIPLSTKRKVWFRPFEKSLAANIKRIQELNRRELLTSTAAADKFERHMKLAPPPTKRARKPVTSIPALHPAVGSSGKEGNVKISAGQLTSVSELCSNIAKLELPSQMAAVLESDLLRHVLSIWPDPSATLRLTYWLQHSLGYELDEYSPGSENAHLKRLLQCLAQLTEFILEPVPTVESFLEILLEVWDGEDYQTEIFQLLSHLSLQPFEDLEERYLQPLKQHFVSKDKKFKFAVLTCLAEMLRNFAVHEWPRHQRRREAWNEGTASHRLSLFSTAGDTEDACEDFEPLDTLRLFVRYVDHLIAVSLEEERNHVLIQHAATRFYEVVRELPTTHGILLSLPHDSLVFGSLLGPDAVALSRTCSLLVSCKENFSKLKRSQRDFQMTHTFNSTVLDFCDSLWRNLAFSDSDRPYPTILFKLSKEHLTICDVDSPHSRLSIIQHPALVGFVRRFFKETQEDSRRLHPTAIWKEPRFKQAYMDFLRENHLNGLVRFIETFVPSRT